MIEFMSAAEQAQLEELRHHDPFVRFTLRQVERILGSRRFKRVQQRARDFLVYIVAKTLLGQADEIKETTIAMAVFGESADYNPAETSKVRVAAADLRQRLAAYAEREGRNDIIHILMPLNTYIPEIRDQRVAIAIMPFENWHPHGEQDYLCKAITLDVAYRLGQAGFRAGLAETFEIGLCRRQFVLRGSVEARNEHLRINVSLADPATGEIHCSRNFEGPREDALKLTQQVSEVLVGALAPKPTRGVPVPVSARRRP